MIPPLGCPSFGRLNVDQSDRVTNFRLLMKRCGTQTAVLYRRIQLDQKSYNPVKDRGVRGKARQACSLLAAIQAYSISRDSRQDLEIV